MRVEPCNTVCLMPGELGMAGETPIWVDPTCPAHAENPRHAFELATTDNHGHELCRCGSVRASHHGEDPCLHVEHDAHGCLDCGALLTATVPAAI